MRLPVPKSNSRAQHGGTVEVAAHFCPFGSQISVSFGKMESCSSDQSVPESDSGSWARFWQQDGLSFVGQDSCSDIKNLDEDKEIASSAVALVVRSTRRGIVPLCADIANLLRARKSLENMVAIQRQELNRLRHVPPPNSVNSSPQTSRSVSPLQTRVTSCRTTSPTNSRDRGVQTQEVSSVCTQCTTASSRSSSEGLQRTTIREGEEVTNDCNVSTREYSSKSHRTRRKLPRQYSLPDMGDSQEKRPPTTKSRSLDDQLSVSSTEVQCDIPNSCENEKLLKQYRETLRLNSKLVEDLTSARKEIESLKRQLAQQEKLALYEDTYRIEHELQQLQQGCDPIDMVQPDEYITLPTMPAADHLPKGINGPASRVHSARPTPPPFSPPPDFRPLLGCKCTICYALQTYGQSAPQPTDGKNGCSTNSRKVLHRPKFHVQLNDHVVLRGDRTGLVRYIGHLDNVGAPAVIYVGIELDAPIGRHDGYVSGKRYFFCHRNHGVFVPIQDVICIINKQQPQANRRPHTVDVKRTSSGSSEMSSGSGQSQSSSGVESSSKTSFELQETSPKRNVRTPTSQLRGKNFHRTSESKIETSSV
ncbi:shootin-1-like isoform X2 [Branchiostoma floridae]|uniref:Shootin-1-like isoform X2 n=1 Tax=Branchiostoma floridae TaxID=7739 RepID=A0A9J7KJ72_BRAFL|nr:shootin-1-like isoform X2 [Branchiostoma floridae]